MSGTQAPDSVSNPDCAGSIRSLHTFQIDIVHGCQLRCVGCPNSTLLEKVRRVAVEDFRRRLENVDVQYVRCMRLFNFGEPLLHDDLTGILRVIQAQPWTPEILEISTNAQHCNWDDFTTALQTGALTRLVASCDGDGSPESFEALRPPAKWSKLLAFLDKARELRDIHAPDLQLVTRTIVENEEAIQRWNEVLLPLGWEPEYREWKYLPESKENMTGRSLAAPADVCTFVAPSERFGERYHGEVNQLYVDADGTVVPCCAHPAAARLGSLEAQPVSELLRSDARRAFVQQLETDRASMPICNQCEFGPPENPGASFKQISETLVEPIRLVN